MNTYESQVLFTSMKWSVNTRSLTHKDNGLSDGYTALPPDPGTYIQLIIYFVESHLVIITNDTVMCVY